MIIKISTYAIMTSVACWTGVLAMILMSCPINAQEATKTRAEQLYKEGCTQCHGLTAVEITRDGRSGWADTVQDMVITGAQLNAEEMELVIDYLTERFGPGTGPMETGKLTPRSPMQTDGTVISGEIELPAGEGKELVQSVCQLCHDSGRIVSARRSDQEWNGYVQNMLAQGGIELPQEENRKLVSYLSRHLGH
jgi:cytochrome c5